MENDDKEFSTEEWINARPEEFHLEDEFREKVFPMLEQVEELCKKMGLPFYMRFFMDQTESGNSSSTISYLGGAGRATPELLALTLLNELDHDTPMQIAGLMMAAVQKFGGGDATPSIFMP